jgi:hypothetical protein
VSLFLRRVLPFEGSRASPVSKAFQFEQKIDTAGMRCPRVLKF